VGNSLDLTAELGILGEEKDRGAARMKTANLLPSHCERSEAISYLPCGAATGLPLSLLKNALTRTERKVDYVQKSISFNGRTINLISLQCAS